VDQIAHVGVSPSTYLKLISREINQLLMMVYMITGVLEMDAGTRASRPEEETEHQVLSLILYIVAPIFLAVMIAIGLFVLLRNWQKSPIYHTFTWQSVLQYYTVSQKKGPGHFRP